MKPRKKLYLIFFAGALIALIALALWPAPIPVNAIRTAEGPFVESIEEEGRTTLRDPAVVTAPITGYLLRVEREVGDPVQKDDVLFQIENLPAPALDARSRRQAVEALHVAEARLAGAEAELAASITEVGHAQREFERIRALEARQAVPEAELDRAQRELDRAKANEQAAQQNENAARYEVRNAAALLEIEQGQRGSEEARVLAGRSPGSGVILRRHRWSEGVIQAGEPIFEIGNLHQLEVQVDLISMDAVRVRPGMEVVLTRWGGSQDLPARVQRVDPSGFTRISALGVDEQRVPVLLALEATPETWSALGEGYRVEARFILWEGDQVLQVPTSALFRHHDGWALYAIEGGRAERRAVEPGRRSGVWTQILSGLSPGEIVITHPGDRVGDGVRVKPDLRPYP